MPNLDPAPHYTPIGEVAGLAMVRLPSGHEAVHLTSYADVQRVLGDNTFGRAALNVEHGPSFLPTISPPELLLNLDEPDHARMRAVVTADFSSAGVARLRPVVERVTATLVDDLVRQGGPGDLYATVLDRVPSRVDCELLGIPEADVEYFRSRSLTVQISDPGDVPGLLKSFEELYGYLMELVRGERPARADGLIRRYVAERDRHDPPLTDEEIVGLLLGILIGGDQNIVTVLTKAVYALLAADGAWARLAATPEQTPRVLEELLRLLPLGAISSFPRLATRDVAVSGGTIRAGQVVYADSWAANRDPAVFTDPLLVDAARPARRHLQFSYGMHHCMGAALARLELDVILRALLERLPTLRLAVTAAEVPWVEGTVVRRPRALPVIW
ncbi:cytochrome P450 [Actinoplanes sp. NEAU-A12]|uniref:Cytochrome P450 n=1 Tax=Actinoplanes sandaracinus TaxID=3045177 RepID=A0ABT6X1A6_9ACTN|nr:cytochrome P450 [Actinoplanes sandaracinus]MDI6105620.1 cytochrome P450 [Actinoplanes sandaracinus]